MLCGVRAIASPVMWAGGVQVGKGKCYNHCVILACEYYIYLLDVFVQLTAKRVTVARATKTAKAGAKVSATCMFCLPFQCSENFVFR